MPRDVTDGIALRPWQVRIIIGVIAAVPLILALTLFHTNAEFYRDLIKDFGVVIAGLLVVNLVWSVVGGEPLENAIKSLRCKLQETRGNLNHISKLTHSAQVAGLVDLGPNSTALQYQPGQLEQLIRLAKGQICMSGLTLQLLHENHDLVTALQNAARSGIPVKLLLASDDNQWLEGSNDNDTLPATRELIRSTVAVLKRAGENETRFLVRVLGEKTFTASMIRVGDAMIVTPYLVSTMTSASPRFEVSGPDSPLFTTWMREFDHLFEMAKPAW
jgi:hypothetical protein